MMPKAARALLLLVPLGCARAPVPSSSTAQPAAAGQVVPLVDHHKHLISAAAGALSNPPLAQVTAEQLVAELDAAGIRRGVVLSVAYWFGRPGRVPPLEDARGLTRAENDFTAREVARYPDRLIGFCSVAPLADYALEEIARCADSLHLKGLKVHLGNSRVDLRDPTHLARAKAIFRAANARRLPIVSHNWGSAFAYEQNGRELARIFLEQLLPEAPDVTVQVAHFAGGGPGYTDPALAVFAEAIAAGDPRTRNLYFDIATVADRQSEQTLRTLAMRIRQVGLDRVLWGSDLALPNGNPPARQGWANFRTTVPLTDEEFRRIATNVAPYLR